ncbi:TonB-dependent receptor [Labilibacter sediminis]|nr:TonB-dependent receptor [Labilibacter sediminis]
MLPKLREQFRLSNLMYYKCMKKKLINPWQASQGSGKILQKIKATVLLSLAFGISVSASDLEKGQKHVLTEGNIVQIENSSEIKTKNGSSYLQDKITVTGKVKDSKGEVLPGVNVYPKSNPSLGVITGIDGDYSLNITDPNETIVFSYIGFVAQEVSAADRKTIDIVLLEEFTDLDEVVVIGYGAVKKSDLTGSVATLDEKSFNKGSVASVDQLIQGRAPGVTISTQSAAPGSDMIFRVRGNNSIGVENSPIFIVDGFPMDKLDNSINPSDIKSMQVLKDASATAIYGTRGANGVVIITTHRGAEGKAQIDYSYEYGIQQVANEDAYNFAGNVAFMEQQNIKNADKLYDFASEEDSINNRYGGNTYTQDLLDAGDTIPSTNWMKEAHQIGHTENHQISIRGGSKDTKAFFSAGYFTQEGVVPNTDFERITGRLNVDQNILKDRLKMGISTGVTSTKTNSLGFGANNLQSNIYRNIFLSSYPMMPVEPNSDINDLFFKGVNPINPLETIYNDKNQSRKTSVLANGYLELNIIDGLKFKSSIGIRLHNSKFEQFVPNGSNAVAAAIPVGSAKVSTNLTTDFLSEQTFHYNKILNGVHNIQAVAGYTYQNIESEDLVVGSQELTNDSYSYNNLDAGVPYLASSYKATRTLISYLGRVNYTYDDRYLVNFTIRTDGSSKFGENNRWGTFPAVGIGWNVHSESFMADQNIFSVLKARASYGITGAERFSVGKGQPTYATIPVYTGSKLENGIVTDNIGNPNIQWEETAQLNLGLNLGFIDNRIVVELDYYNKETTKLIVDRDLPLSTGIPSMIDNIGAITNQGFELLLTTRNISKPDFSWTTTFNLAYNKNEIKEVNLPEGVEFLPGNEVKPIGGVSYQPYTIIKEGLPVNTFYGYRYHGVMTEEMYNNGGYTPQPESKPGDPLFKDLNGDKIINEKDQEVLGTGYPAYTYGINNSIGYKNWDFSFFINGVADVEILNLNRFIGFEEGRIVEEESWSAWNPDGTAPRTYKDLTYGGFINDKWVEKGDYIRLKNVSLAYTIPVKRWSFIKSLQVYATATNLLTWTKYSGFDPEVSSQRSASSNLNIGAGMDMYSYPYQKTYSFGVRLSIQ